MNIFDPLISGSLSVSGSGEISGDLTVLGALYATVSGTTSNAISASHAAEYLLTSSFEDFTGSLNLNKIVSGSVSASISPDNGFTVNTNVTVSGSILPNDNLLFDLGSDTKRWRDIYLAGNTINLGGTKISKNNSGDVEVRDGSDVLKKVVANEFQIGEGDNSIVIKRDQSTGYFRLAGQTQPYIAAQLSGSFTGSGAGLYNIPASGVTGLNLSQISEGSVTASISQSEGFRVNTDVELTGSLKISNIDLGVDKTIIINVTDSNGKYFIDGSRNPVLTLIKGFTYKFLYPNMASHPFRFSTTSDGTHNSGTIYTTGVTTGSSPDYIQIEVTEDTPSTLYYFCTVHHNMGNSISIFSDFLNLESDRNVVYIDPTRIATTGSNIFIGDQDVTGSVNITGSITLNGQLIGTGKLDETTFNSYTSSNDNTNTTQSNRLDSLESTSGSHNDRIGSLESTSGSHNDRIGSLESTSGSHSNRLDAIETSTGSLNQFTSSINTTIKDRLSAENVISGSIQIDIVSTSGYTSFSSSIAATDLTQENRLDSLETESGSIRDDFNSITSSFGDRIDSLETESGSIRNDFNSYTSSNDPRVNSLENTSGSHNDRLDAIEVSTGSLNSFTSSINTTIKNKLNNDGVISGSVQIDITGTSGYSSFSSSIDTSISASVSALSSSVKSYNDLQDDRLDVIESRYATTGSNSFLGNQSITGSLIITDNLTVLGSSSIVYSTASQLIVEDNVIVVNSSYPAERFAGIEVHDSGSNGSVTASLFWDGLNNRWIYQNTSDAHYGGGMLIAGPRNTGSLGDEPGLTSGKLPKSIGGDHIGDSIMNEDGSTIYITGSLSATGTVYGTNISAIETSTSSLNSYTSALKTAIELTGSNLTVKGDLLVKGTTTNVNTTTLNVDNNLITLNGTGATSAGIRVNDTTGPNLVSGSLLWDATNDYWIAGQLGSEQRLVRETEFNNAVTRIGNVETSTGSLNSFTSSINTTIKNKLNADGVISGSSQITGINNDQITNPSFYVGTTSISLGRASASQTLTGVSIDGNSATVTNGVYTTGTQTIGGSKTFSSNITNSADADWYMYGFGARGASSGAYGMGLASDIANRTLSMHIPNLAAYSNTGNTPKFGWYSNGSVELMTLQSATGNLVVTGTISASNLSGTNTGDQTNITGNAGTVTNGVYTTGDQTITGQKTFPDAIGNRPILAGGFISAATGDLNADLWGISEDYYPSHATAGNAWGIRWSGDTNDIQFVGGGSNRFIFDLDNGNLTATGTLSASNFSGTSSGTNTGDQTLSGLGGQPQLNGTGFVKAAGTTISYDNSTYQTVGATHYVGTTSIANNRASAAQTLTGVSIDGSASSATLLTASGGLTTQQGSGTVGYVYALSTSTSGIFSVVDNSNSILTVNRHPDNYYSQLGFSSNGNIYYRSFSATAINTSQAWQTIWTSTSLTNLNQLSNGPGYITGVSWAGVSSKPASWLDDTNLIGTNAPNTVAPSGFYQYSANDSGNPAGTWFNYVNVRHSNTGNGHGYQIGMSYYDSNLWYRSYQGGLSPTFAAWRLAKDFTNSTYATSFTSVSSVTVTHNLGSKDVLVMCYDSSDAMFWPSSIVTTSTSVVTITFSTNRTGRVVVVR